MASRIAIGSQGMARLFTLCRLPYTSLARKEVRHLRTSCKAFNSYIVSSPHSDVQQPPGNLVNTVFEHVERWGSNVALESPQTGQSYTYNYLLEAVSKWAGFLTSLGLTKGDVIAICVPNCMEYPILTLGAIRTGLVVSPINNNYTAEEIARQVKSSKAKLLVGDVELESTIRASQMIHDQPLHLVMNGPTTIPSAFNLHEILKDPAVPFVDPVEMTGEEVAMMPYSSGTTGVPKGVAMSHKAITIAMRMFTHPSVFVSKYAEGGEQATYMCLIPFYHIYGFLVLQMIGLNIGAKLIPISVFEPQSYLNLVKKYKIEDLHLVPPLLNFLATSPLATSEHLGCVKNILVGAAPVSPHSAAVLRSKIHPDSFIQEGYGMTEVMVTNMTPKGCNRIGTTGQLLSNVSAKIIDTDTGEDLPSTEIGEICIRTPGLMNGYFENETATAATIDSERWLHTGDVGVFDEEGFLKIVDRTKELIKVKGLQVSPSELEDLIREHPQVLDVGVVGIPHDRFGEAPRAFVVSKEEISADDINKFLDPRVAPYKKLVGGVYFVNELPKSNTGKLLRRELKNMSIE